ncbi:ribonuclease H-like domain-containing protein [Calothrix sp. NIES-3974]|uniref:ribonuclease H-like domain-containing protein n=1 Tax=Calothrix sp. NIES-3974 TaxID=2005462 RepID=UPI000B600263|nr:ribonuclease H-like domain-containing protein [Calothrix sp. NIES-3974]BAZ07176.1 3'-5' exonuclease [Calothrix sp. NIES-3974]
MTSGTFQVCDRDLSDEILSTYLSKDAIAVDTETMGLVHGRDRLCLVQLCDRDGNVTVVRIIRGQNQAANLQKLLEARDITKVFHYARFDLAALRANLQIQVQPVFCTKIASKLARTYTSSHGLKALIQELEQVELDKSAQSSDWGNVMNLTPEQLNYAANDVRYLLSARDKLIEMLKREERWEIAIECFRCLPTIVSLDLMQFSGIFEH